MRHNGGRLTSLEATTRSWNSPASLRRSAMMRFCSTVNSRTVTVTVTCNCPALRLPAAEMQ
jgi:hypothetical protein